MQDFGSSAIWRRPWPKASSTPASILVTAGAGHGTSSRDLPAARFVVFSQNHDQVGNRMLGERLSHLVSFEGLKLAAGRRASCLPLSPCCSWARNTAKTAPFQYFISHSDPELVEAVRRGRREEFAAFRWTGEPPDPQDEGDLSPRQT